MAARRKNELNELSALSLMMYSNVSEIRAKLRSPIAKR